MTKNNIHANQTDICVSGEKIDASPSINKTNKFITCAFQTVWTECLDYKNFLERPLNMIFENQSDPFKHRMQREMNKGVQDTEAYYDIFRPSLLGNSVSQWGLLAHLPHNSASLNFMLENSEENVVCQ